MAEVLFEEGELAGQPSHVIKRAFDAYNAAARAAGWPETANLTESRQKRLKVAVRDCGGLAGWELALARAQKSDFLCGKTKSFRAPTGFKGTKLDFFLRADRRASLLDGEYDNRIQATGPGPSGPSFQQRMKAATTDRPAKELPFVSTETETERLAAIIRAYRRHGQHRDANRVEERLAKLECRPPTLVPAPELADLGMPPKAPTERHSAPSSSTAAATDIDYEMIPEGEDFGNE